MRSILKQIAGAFKRVERKSASLPNIEDTEDGLFETADKLFK
jgi:hypothetical protein